MSFIDELEQKKCRFADVDKLDSGDKLRLKLFIKDYPSIFTIKDEEIIIDVNHYKAFSYLNNYYLDNDRAGYLTLLEKVQYFLLPIDNKNFSPEFMWNMMVKYKGDMKLITNTDRRKWKINLVIDEDNEEE